MTIPSKRIRTDNYHVSLKKYEEKIYTVYDEGNWRSFMKVI
jgi:hypothetical protein